MSDSIIPSPPSSSSDSGRSTSPSCSRTVPVSSSPARTTEQTTAMAAAKSIMETGARSNKDIVRPGHPVDYLAVRPRAEREKTLTTRGRTDNRAKRGFEEYPQVNHIAAGSSENNHRYGVTKMDLTKKNGHEMYQSGEEVDTARPHLPYLSSGEMERGLGYTSTRINTDDFVPYASIMRPGSFNETFEVKAPGKSTESRMEESTGLDLNVKEE